MMATQPMQQAAGPVREAGRITSLDLVRGVAVLGILAMNAVSFRFGSAPYFNLSAGGSVGWVDWVVGVGGEVLVDQKFMGMFSLLFGAGMVLFMDRAAARGGRATARGGRAAALNLWRNALLLVVGAVHMAAWDGDVLVAYALASVVLLALRGLPNWWLVGIGAGVFGASALVGLAMQGVVNSTQVSLAGVWTAGDAADDSVVGLMTLAGFGLRAVGAILMGAGLYRIGFMSGKLSAQAYRRTAVVGLGVGLPLAVVGVVVTALGGYSREVAFIGQVPNTLGTLPAALGYISVIVLWDARAESGLKRRLRAVGRMALTNYLAQTALGLLVLTYLLEGSDWASRSVVALFVAAVWALQLWWSQAWLGRFLFGPAEWLWRVGTYRKGQSLRRARAASSSAATS